MTVLIQQRVKEAPLCKEELSQVTVEEIEVAERDLMLGINYEMRCHHPHNAVRVLACEVEKFFNYRSKDRHTEGHNELDYCQPSNESPYDCQAFHVIHDEENSIEERALLVAQNALLFSDAPFLFPPGQIAFAAVAISLREEKDTHWLPLTLRTYLRKRFTKKTENELLCFEERVSIIVKKLLDSPIMDMKMIEMSGNILVCDRVVAEQAEELRRVFNKVSNLRISFRNLELSMQGEGRKRKLPETTLNLHQLRTHDRVVKVTPIKL